jgi:hypothetical protein
VVGHNHKMGSLSWYLNDERVLVIKLTDNMIELYLFIRSIFRVASFRCQITKVPFNLGI